VAEKNEDIALATRVPRALYERILGRQREVQQLTGIEPSVSALIRASLERDLVETIEQRQAARPTRLSRRATA
jgi:hypothetical protein